VQEAEMKRLYVRAAYRGLGLGSILIDGVVAAASEAGFEMLRLDTLPTMAAAQALYVRHGFIETPPYNTAVVPGTRWYARAVVPRSSERF
jgi:putative acetyltransferase